MNRPVAFYVDIPLKDGTVRCRLTQRLREQYCCWAMPRHSTSDYELHVLTEGEARVCFDGAEEALTQGKGLIIAPDIAHEFSCAAEHFKRFYIHFSVEGAALRRSFRQAVTPYKLCEVPGDVTALAENVVEELLGSSPYRKQVIESALCLLVLKVFRQAEIVLDEPFYPLEDGNLERRNIVESFFQKSMTVQDGETELADRLGVSTRQLLRLLREYYGMSYREMMTHTRMDRAAWLLRTTETPLPEIAETVGYGSEASFRKAFHARYGVTPRQYRNQN